MAAPVDGALPALNGALLSLQWRIPFAGLLLATLMGPLATTLKAISMAAVYFGALTYIGDAPNFMIKAIAEDRGVVMPSFFTYVVYAAVLLVPLLALVAPFEL